MAAGRRRAIRLQVQCQALPWDAASAGPAFSDWQAYPPARMVFPLQFSAEPCGSGAGQSRLLDVFGILIEKGVA